MTMQRNAKVTGWFPGHVKPTLKGMYERLYDGTAGSMDYWSGRVWRYDSPQGRIALRQNRMWRGLASDPKAVQP